jgi:hypothetical protein
MRSDLEHVESFGLWTFDFRLPSSNENLNTNANSRPPLTALNFRETLINNLS